MNTSHLDALNLRLSHERVHLSNAKTDNERQMRRVWIAQIEKEIESEKKFLNMSERNDTHMSDEDLLRALED